MMHTVCVQNKLRDTTPSSSLARGQTCRVTGRGHIDINRISGYLPGKIVFYLMQVSYFWWSLLHCQADVTRVATVVLDL